MNLFTYLMSKKGYEYLPHKDLFSYLLGKNNSSYKTLSGTEITFKSIKGKLNSLMLTKESTQATSILPSGYTQVDYIQSSGTEYIDTNYNLTSENEKVEMVFSFTSIPRPCCPFGSYYNAQSITPYGSTSIGMYVGYSTNLLPQTVTTDTLYDLRVSANSGALSVSWNNQEQTATYNTPLGKSKIYIFAQNYYYSSTQEYKAENFCNLKVYSFKLYRSEEHTSELQSRI